MSVRSIDRTPDIVAEIRRVLERFGVELIGAKDDAPTGGKELQIDLTNTQQVNRFLESRGADIYLLCTIGSWKDTISDKEVLRELRQWLKDAKSIRPELSFARLNLPF